MAAQGSFLFRWRSFLPLFLFVIAISALPQSGYFEHLLGERAEGVWDMFCLVVAFAGLALRVVTNGFAPSGTSGRNTRRQRADVLNTSGVYSVMRNPLYLGNLIILLAFLLATKVWWVTFVAMPLAIVYYERIILAEERYLSGKFGKTYDAWAERTPVWLPALGQWSPPQQGFSTRTVIRREYHSFYLIVLTMTAIELLTDVVGEGETVATWAAEHPGWIAFLGAGTTIYVTLRLVRKRSGWLVNGSR